MLHYIKSEEKYQLMAVYAAMLPVVSTRDLTQCLLVALPKGLLTSSKSKKQTVANSSSLNYRC